MKDIDVIMARNSRSMKTIRATRTHLVLLALCLTGPGLLALSETAEAHTRWRANGFGGSCSAGVVAARGGAASTATSAAFFGGGECCVPAGVYIPCRSTAPLPGGANAGTFAGAWYRPGWRGASRARSMGGDGWGTQTINAERIACDSHSESTFELKIAGDTYFLTGSWYSTNPLAVGTVCVECGGIPIHCTQQSGAWSGQVHESGILCPAQPGPGQTPEDWYAENLYLTGEIDTPADSQCAQ